MIRLCHAPVKKLLLGLLLTTQLQALPGGLVEKLRDAAQSRFSGQEVEDPVWAPYYGHSVYHIVPYRDTYFALTTIGVREQHYYAVWEYKGGKWLWIFTYDDLLESERNGPQRIDKAYRDHGFSAAMEKRLREGKEQYFPGLWPPPPPALRAPLKNLWSLSEHTRYVIARGPATGSYYARTRSETGQATVWSYQQGQWKRLFSYDFPTKIEAARQLYLDNQLTEHLADLLEERFEERQFASDFKK